MTFLIFLMPVDQLVLFLIYIDQITHTSSIQHQYLNSQFRYFAFHNFAI